MQTADLSWRDGHLPIATAFDDPYFALEDGRGESRAVFIAGNLLPGRWSAGAGAEIGELGFGTGLNFLETLAAWRRHRARRARGLDRLRYTAFEAFPLLVEDMRRVLTPWPDLSVLAQPVLDRWDGLSAGGTVTFDLGDCTLDVILGDAREQLPAWKGWADAWYLDGFSPAKNPELWQPDLLRAVADRTRPGGTFSTYTAAGWVRRGLIDAGFDVQRVPGFGSKRERLQGRKV